MDDDELDESTLDQTIEDDLRKRQADNSGPIRREIENEIKGKVANETYKARKKIRMTMGRPVGVTAFSTFFAIATLLFVLIGGVAFITSMPGMVQEQILNKLLGGIDNLGYIVNGSDYYLDELASDPDKTKQKEVLKYLDEMGIDPAGFGFAAFYNKDPDTGEVTYEAQIDSNITNDGWGIFSAIDYNKKVKEDVINNDLIFKYLLSNERTYLVEEGDKVGTILKLGDQRLKGMIKTEIDGLDDTSITVDRANKKLIFNSFNATEFANQKVEYDMDGWTGRYGMSLEFLLALHLATMTSDLPEEMATNEKLQTEVKLETEKSDYKVKFNVRYKGKELPIEAGTAKNRTALNKYTEGKYIRQNDDGTYYLKLNDKQKKDFKSKLSIYSLKTWIDELRKFNFSSWTAADDIYKITNQAKNALLGEDEFRVVYRLVPSRYTGEAGIWTSYFGDMDDDVPESLFDSTEEAEDGNTIYKVDGYEKYAVGVSEDGTAKLDTIDEFGSYDAVEGSGIEAERGYVFESGTMHGIEYYLKEEHTSELKEESARLGMMCMLSQIDAYLAANDFVPEDGFTVYSRYNKVADEWSEGEHYNFGVRRGEYVAGLVSDTDKTYRLLLTKSWIDFCDSHNGIENCSDEEIRDELTKLSEDITQYFEIVNANDNHLEDEQIEQVLQSAYDQLDLGITELSIANINEIYKVLEQQETKKYELAMPRIAHVIKHWYKDIVFYNADLGINVYSKVDDTWTESVSGIDNPNLEIIAEFSGGDGRFIQDGEPYVIKGDVVTLEGAVVENSNLSGAEIDGNKLDDGKKGYKLGDGYKTTKKLFTQGKYYTYDGSRDTAKSIAYAKELEKLGTDGYNYAHVVVKNGRISVARLIKDTEIGEEIVNGAAIYNTATDQWNQSAFRVSEQRENENLGDIVTDKLSEKGWSVFLSGATNSSIDDSKLNGYYIKVNQEMKYLSPADNSVEDTNRSVDRINSMLEAMGVITTRRPVSFDNTTENGDVNTLMAFSILEGMHTQDSEYIYRDLKEFLIELGYYTKAEFELLDTKVLKWFIPDYSPSSAENKVVWRQNKDQDALLYGAVIYPKEESDEQPDLEEENEEPEDENTEVEDETESTENKLDGFTPGLDVIAPGNARVVKISPTSITLEFDGVTEPEISALDRYQMIIDGINVVDDEAIEVVDKDNNEYEKTLREVYDSDRKYIVKSGSRIGTTGNVRIQVVMKNNRGGLIDNVEDYMGPQISTVSGDGTSFSITGTVLSETEFVNACLSYMDSNGISNPDFSASNMSKFYDICRSKGVNPEFAFVTAVTESGLTAGEATSTHNYWGLDTPNGSSVPSLGTMLETLSLYCDRLVEYQDPLGSHYQAIMQRYEERKACTENGGCNPNGYGEPNTLQGLQSIYSYLGKHEYGGPGDGGEYYMDPARAGVTAIYSTHEEFIQKCKNVHTPGSETTVWEQAQYTAWQVEKKIEKARAIFGDKAGRYMY